MGDEQLKGGWERRMEKQRREFVNKELKKWRVGRKQREGKRLCIQDGIISPKKKNLEE